MKPYRPLPEYLKIKDSPIEGQGLFATADIPKGTNLGRSHFKIWNQIERTPLGGFYNHSDEPNVRRQLAGNNKWILMTIKDIKAGEELTAKYSLYNIKDGD